MENPFYIAELRPLSGLTTRSVSSSSGQPITTRFLAFAPGLPDLRIPAYISEGKTRLTIASAAPADITARSSSPRSSPTWLRDRSLGRVAVSHRELDRA